jgi:predicted amidohydrolase
VAETAGRPVRITSISFGIGRTLAAVARMVEQEGARGTDLIVLPETWLGQQTHEPETLDGPVIAAIAPLAKAHDCWIVCPIDRSDGRHRLNSAVLIDRNGSIACVYDKMFPYQKELVAQPPVRRGARAAVHATDFGALGMAICFDVNFPEVWQGLASGGAEVVAWPSEYAGGTTLQAHALMNHYYIVSATQAGHCLVYDITGREMLSERSTEVNISRIVLDLDRGLYHEDFNMEKLQSLLADHAGEVEVELHLPTEKWVVLRALLPGVSARLLAKEYGMEELRDYIARNRRELDRARADQD